MVYKKYGVYDKEIVLNGNVELQDVKISFRTQGRVKKILVDEGEHVKKGQILASLDTDILDSQLQLSISDLSEAITNFNNCKKDFNRNRELYKKHSISEKIYDDTKVKYEISQSRKEGAEARYNLALISKNDSIIKSPNDGTIITKNIEVGEMTIANSPSFSIMPHRQKRIKTYANAENLQYIKVGDKVIIDSTLTKSKKFKGHVAFISSNSEFTPKNIETKELRTSLVYRIRIMVDENDKEKELKQGMPVSIYFSPSKK
jgi:HlyD family secretion protein